MNVSEFIEEFIEVVCAEARARCDGCYLLVLAQGCTSWFYHMCDHGDGLRGIDMFVIHEYQLTRPKWNEERSTDSADEGKLARVEWGFSL